MSTAFKGAPATRLATAPDKSRRPQPAVLLAIAVSLVWIAGAVALGFGSAHPGSQATARAVGPAPIASVIPAIPATSPVTAAAGADIAKAAADIPPPITRTVPTTVNYVLTTTELTARLDDGTTYQYWTFDNTVPGPFLRVLQGDTVNLTIKNQIGSTMPHSIDLHAVSGPGGGSVATQTGSGKDTMFSFKALNAGLYLYHCATAPVAMHVANGMFGMILVEPPGGLPKVDHEYYVMQSEVYTDSPLATKGLVRFSNDKLMAEQPTYYVFNGRVGSLIKDGALHAKVGETVRIYFGVGTFKSAAFHVIGTIFDNVYSDGGIGGAVEHNVGLVNVPAGGTTIVDLSLKVPGAYTIVDHALQRVAEGAAGQLLVAGPANPEVFDGPSSAPMPH